MSSTLPPPGRGAKVGLAIVAAIAAVGFFTGTRHAPSRGGYRERPAQTELARPEAPRQRDVERVRYAQRMAEQQSALTALATPPRALTDEVALDPEAYANDVARRAGGRAYDGAPPTIPHVVDQDGAPACLACHERGVSVLGKVAKPMSHEPYTSCTQCHVVREGPLPRAARMLDHSVATESRFVGLASPGRGTRAWPGAPPQMPHRSFMRERCVACHGVWAEGLASSHPHRQSCAQCHVPSASADQTPRSAFDGTAHTTREP